MILIFYAFAREIAPFRRRVGNRAPIALEGLQGFRANVGGREIVAVGHGIGHKRAADSVRRAFNQMPVPELVIGTGVVGALSSGLKPGDLIVSERVLAIERDGQTAEQVAVANAEDLRAVGRSLGMANIAYSSGAILTSHRVLVSGAEKRRAKECTGAIAVDMETAAIATEANARDIRFVAIRAVLDEVDDEVFGVEMTDENGDVRPLALTSYLLRNPGTMLKLPKMIRNLSRATASIADALVAIVHEGRVPEAMKRARESAARTHRR